MVELTETDRASVLSQLAHGLGEDVLAVIDEQAALIAQTERQRDYYTTCYQGCYAELQEARAIIDMCSSNFDAMVEERDLKDTERTRADAAEERISKAVTWLVTYNRQKPAYANANAVRLALEALRG